MLGSKGPRQAPAFLKAPALDTDRTGQHASEARQRVTRGSKTMVNHSFRIAARGLSFIARSDGKNPAIIPTSTAKNRETAPSQGGI